MIGFNVLMQLRQQFTLNLLLDGRHGAVGSASDL